MQGLLPVHHTPMSGAAGIRLLSAGPPRISMSMRPRSPNAKSGATVITGRLSRSTWVNVTCGRGGHRACVRAFAGAGHRCSSPQSPLGPGPGHRMLPWACDDLPRSKTAHLGVGLVRAQRLQRERKHQDPGAMAPMAPGTHLITNELLMRRLVSNTLPLCCACESSVPDRPNEPVVMRVIASKYAQMKHAPNAGLKQGLTAWSLACPHGDDRRARMQRPARAACMPVREPRPPVLYMQCVSAVLPYLPAR